MSILSDELTTDPLGRGYGGMTDGEAAVDLNLLYRSKIAEQMSGDEIFQQTDPPEFSSLQQHKQDLWLAFCARDVIDPGATANEELVKWIFGAGSVTVASLVATRSLSISRGDELGLGHVKHGHVQQARA